MGLFTKESAGFVKLVGGASTSSIFNYNDQTRQYEIFTPWKNGRAKPSLKRPLDTIAYEDMTKYAIFVKGHEVSKSGLGRAVGLGFLFGGPGAIVGAITGRQEYQVIDQVGIALETSTGDTYKIPFLVSLNGEKADSFTARAALAKADTVARKLESTGARLSQSWSVDLNQG